MRDTKNTGKKVKTFTAYIPGDSVGEKDKKVISISFHARDSEFSATLPRHVVDAIGHHPEKPSKMHGDRIVSKLADDIEPSFEAALKLYTRIQQNEAKTKVIKVVVNANVASTHMPPNFQFKEISFAGRPCLSLTYEILWRVGDGLYRLDEDRRGERMPFLTYMSHAPKNDQPSVGYGRGQEMFVIDWTEEREEFFKRMHDGLETLISRIAYLLAGDTAANVDQLVLAGYAGLLPAPSVDD